MNSTLSALIAAFMAGIVQGTTGFGAGIVMMMVLPLFFALPQSAGISTAISIVICLSVAWRYRRAINLRKALIPSALYIVICSLVISFSVTVNQTRLKHVFGAFLLLLAAYYLFIARPDKRFNLNVWARLICISVSAACDGLFGIGGPLMVLYYMNTTATTDEYFGTLQTFFLMNSLWNTGFRLCRGF